jgi:hypothetical protein
MRIAAITIAAFLVATPAMMPVWAQREAISATLSPEAANAAFNDAVITACIPAVSGNGMGGIPAPARAKFAPTNDVGTRKQAGAAADETVWDALSAKGVVTIHEKRGRCVVSVYGPPAAPAIIGLAGVLSSTHGFERLVGTGGPGQSLMKSDQGKRLMVQLNASEPGMPGHASRFTVITATVFVAS